MNTRAIERVTDEDVHEFWGRLWSFDHAPAAEPKEGSPHDQHMLLQIRAAIENDRRPVLERSMTHGDVAAVFLLATMAFAVAALAGAPPWLVVEATAAVPTIALYFIVRYAKRRP